MTLFLTQSLGAPAVLLGLVEGCAEAVVSFVKAWSGWHSDRRGQRVPYVTWGYGTSAISRPLLGLATGWPLVFVARTLDRFGKGIRTSARDALIAQAAPEGQKGRAFGFHRTLDTSGAVVGIAFATWWMSTHIGQYRELFYVSAIPGALAVLLTLFVSEPTAAPQSLSNRVALQSVRELPKTYWMSLAVVAVFALANSSDTFLLLRAHQLGASDASTVGLYGLFYLSYAIVSYPAGLLSDRIGRWTTIVVGWLLYSLVYLGFAYAQFQALLPLFLFYGVYMGLSEGVTRAALSDRAPVHLQGTAQGVLGLTLGLTTLTSNLISGLLWDRVGPSAPFYLGSLCSLVAAGLAASLFRPGKTHGGLTEVVDPPNPKQMPC